MVTFASPPMPRRAPAAPPGAPNTSNVAEVMPAGTVHVALPALNVSICCVGVLVTVAVGVLVTVAVGVLVTAAVGVLVGVVVTSPVGAHRRPVCPKF